MSPLKQFLVAVVGLVLTTDLFLLGAVIPTGEKQYHVFPIKLDWFAAKDYCQEKGMQLATTRSEEQSNSTVTYLEESNICFEIHGACGFWLGANNLADDEVFRWQPDQEKISYHRWMDGEPNNAYKSENCVELLYVLDDPMRNWTWNDNDCKNSKFLVLCESTLSAEKDAEKEAEKEAE